MLFLLPAAAGAAAVFLINLLGLRGGEGEYSFRSNPAGGTGIFVGAEEQGKPCDG